MSKYKIIALVGEAGSGKDRVLQQTLKKKNNYFHEVVHFTTRPPREREVNKKDYYFITDTDYRYYQTFDKILVESEYNNWHYGVSKANLSTDKINIGVFNLQEIKALSSHEDVELFIVKVAAADRTRLIRQLSREKHPNCEEIIRRFAADKEEYKNLSDYAKIWSEKRNENKFDLWLLARYLHRQGSAWATFNN